MLAMGLVRSSAVDTVIRSP